MNTYWIYLLVCLSAAATSLILTPLVKLVALKFKWLDLPSVRKVHYQPMVRLGGVAIFFSTLLSTALTLLIFSCERTSCNLVNTLTHLGIATETVTRVEPTLAVLLGGIGFFFVGFADDLYDLSALNRLWMQSTIALLIWMLGIRVDLIMPASTEIWRGASLLITVVWLVGVVNAINWIDGLDGLASGAAGIAACTLMILAMANNQAAVACLCLALAGGIFGFWCYNYSPAEIFMGDGGSYFVGFMLAGISILGAQPVEGLRSTMLPLVVLAVPLIDMCAVIFLRLCDGDSPFAADNRHLHHRLISMGLLDREAVSIIHSLCVFSGCLALSLSAAISLWIAIAVLLATCFAISRSIGHAKARFINNSNIINGEV